MPSTCQNYPVNSAFVELSKCLLPAPAGEVTIDAFLLYEYIGKHLFSAEEFIATLKSYTQTNSMKFRLSRGRDGTPALNYELALRVIAPSTRRLAGAIVFDAMIECDRDPQRRNPEFVNDELRNWMPLALGGGHSAARYLHRYLEISRDYDVWLAEHMKRLKMKHRRDYFSGPCEMRKPGTSFPMMSAKEFIVTWEMAEKIVMAEETARAIRIRELWDTHNESC